MKKEKAKEALVKLKQFVPKFSMEEFKKGKQYKKDRVYCNIAFGGKVTLLGYKMYVSQMKKHIVFFWEFHYKMNKKTKLVIDILDQYEYILERKILNCYNNKKIVYPLDFPRNREIVYAILSLPMGYKLLNLDIYWSSGLRTDNGHIKFRVPMEN